MPSHVGIKGNEMADKAAKEGICPVITQNYQEQSVVLVASK